MKPKIIITIGDYNGVGPEVIIKTLNDDKLRHDYDLTVITPAGVLEYYSEISGITLKGPFELLIMDEEADISPGELSVEAGKVAGKAIETAVNLCMKKEYDAMVTAPINKKALNLGGYNYDGHTEMLTALTNTKESLILMCGPDLKIAFASTHPPLSKAASLVTKASLVNKLIVSVHSLRKDFGIDKPKIAVLGLNPHAGDEGQIGDEEIKMIKPAINYIKQKYSSLQIDGPFPADGFFGTEKYKQYDLIFAMYHDQGFIPFKMIAGFNGVNFTAGLPVIRTSPDHGTAFDIAAKDIAKPDSLIEAVILAASVHEKRNRN